MNSSSLCCARCTRRSCAVHDGLDDAVLYPMYSTKLRSTRRTRRRCVAPDVLDEAAQYTTDSTTLCCTRCTRRGCAVHDGLDEAASYKAKMVSNDVVQGDKWSPGDRWRLVTPGCLHQTGINSGSGQSGWKEVSSTCISTFLVYRKLSTYREIYIQPFESSSLR